MARTRSWLLPFALCVVVGSVQAAQEEQRVPVEIPTREAVILKFKAFDPSRVLIDEQAVLKELTKALEKKSQLPLSVKGGIVGHVSGLRTKLEVPQSRIAFEYVNLDRYDSGRDYGQSLAIPVSYEMTRTDQEFSIRLTPSQTGELMTWSSRGIFRVPTPKLNPTDELLLDFSSILNGAPQVVVTRQCVVKGEKTSKYRPEALIGNFERLLGRYTVGSSQGQSAGVEPGEVFAYLAGQTRVALTVNAIPYRDGAKIIYSASLPYTLRTDGTGEGYDLPEKLSADIDRILAD